MENFVLFYLDSLAALVGQRLVKYHARSGVKKKTIEKFEKAWMPFKEFGNSSPAPSSSPPLLHRFKHICQCHNLWANPSFSPNPVVNSIPKALWLTFITVRQRKALRWIYSIWLTSWWFASCGWFGARRGGGGFKRRISPRPNLISNHNLLSLSLLSLAFVCWVGIWNDPHWPVNMHNFIDFNPSLFH